MALVKLTDYYPNYKEQSPQLSDIKNFGVYGQDDNKIGSVHDILIDSGSGRFRYFVLDVGPWILGKKVLLPVGQARLDQSEKRLYVNMMKEQVEKLPSFDDLKKIDQNYEEQVRGVYRPGSAEMPLEQSAGMGVGMATGTVAMSSTATTEMPLETPITPAETTVSPAINTTGMNMGTVHSDVDTVQDVDIVRDTTTVHTDVNPVHTDLTNDYSYNYDRDPDMYNLNGRDHQELRLYEERLIADKHRHKVGEVVIGKRITTEQAHTTVPIERERIVVERITSDGETIVDNIDFDNMSEVARMEVYEEVPEVRKETFVREEIRIKKIVEREVANVDETLRREELDMNTEGNPIVDNNI